MPHIRLKSAAAAMQVLKLEAAAVGLSTLIPVYAGLSVKDFGNMLIIGSGKWKSSRPHGNVLSRVSFVREEIVAKKSPLLFGNLENLNFLINS
jgi:hypothetical protein